MDLPKSEQPLDPYRILYSLNDQELQYVASMAKRLGVSFMQAVRRFAKEQEDARKK